MKKNIPEIEELVKLISKLPGLGPKSAKRIVLKLINNREELIKPLANTLAQVYKNIVRCNICGNIKSSNSSCTFQTCSYSDKNYKQICVVENIADMWVIENSGIYKGYYHILGGTLSSFDNKKTDNYLIFTYNLTSYFFFWIIKTHWLDFHKYFNKKKILLS